MTIYIGPNKWWWTGDTCISNNLHYAYIAKICPLGTATRDGASLICKAGGVAWFVAPASTQVTGQWGGGQYMFIKGNICCVSEWFEVCNALIAGGVECVNCWFIPSGGFGGTGQLYDPGFVCRTHWDSFDSDSYWSSSETCTGGIANYALYTFFGGGFQSFNNKRNFLRVRAFRCITY
jgi:hypothetical protein